MSFLIDYEAGTTFQNYNWDWNIGVKNTYDDIGIDIWLFES